MPAHQISLDKHLVLNSYLCSLLGKKKFDDFQSALKDARDGFDEEGRSFVFHNLVGLSELKIPRDDLERYDNNIKGYIDQINKRRNIKIELKYFQYLAVLFTEIFLDSYFKDPIGFLNSLNDHIHKVLPRDSFAKFAFSRNDLTKLAFWMATGSGKTIIMHINYLQFLKYNKGPYEIKIENILLIAPYEALSYQHLDELRQSNISCELFSKNQRGYFSSTTDHNRIKVLDIHKLTEEDETQEGVSVNVSRFGPNNLVFVDEGHKGTATGEKWVKLRKELVKKGFTFEYSATFGQAIASANTSEKDALVAEYGKSIIFDYSYRYFYNDGYGKEYRIVNLKKDLYEEFNDTLMVANLLSFYEQKLLFDDYQMEVKDNNIEEPLWIFVGGQVSGKYNRSDILKIAQFIDKVLKNEGTWAVKTVESILNGKSGLKDEYGRDLFSPSYPEKRLQYLLAKNIKPDDLYKDLLSRVFHIAGPAPLHLVNLKKASGEIALKAGASDRRFGVINIGDDSEFLKLVKQTTTIPVEDDEMSPSLFDAIKEPNSDINLLIGAKKFIEGWDCWRVSNMGLLNVGKKEGSQIIQLFGRGVRLKGRGFSLKRSRPEDSPPEYLRTLETLNIFGIKANYMDEFRKHLEEEGIQVDLQEIPFDIKIEESYLNKGLLIPAIDMSRFKKEYFLKLEAADELRRPKVDLRPVVDILTSIKEEEIQAMEVDSPQKIEKDYLDLLDWDRIYFELLEYKRLREWNNIVLSKDAARSIIEKNLYTLYCSTKPKNLIRPAKFEDVQLLEDMVISILKNYLQLYYNHHRNDWTANNMEVAQLRSDHDNLNFERYALKIKEDKPLVIEAVKSEVKSQRENICRGANGVYLKNVYFDRHLYQPLLAASEIIDMSPSGLNEGEQMFVEDLRKYFIANSDLYEGKEVFVLRNLSRKGIGFFDRNYFYPDFIIWVKSNNKQHIIFAEPHGLVHTAGLDDEKILLHEEIKKIQKHLAKKMGAQNLTLDSFIISVTPYSDLAFLRKNKHELEKHNILFLHDDRGQYIAKMMDVTLNS